MANYKPLSKVSTSKNFSTSIVGSLWDTLTQLDAAKVCRNMYNNDGGVGVESDLVNSYAWDTAIVFIQEMGNTNYANKTSVNSSFTNTGTTGDEVCNVFDLASNNWEWCTEYSPNKSDYSAFPCTYRGGRCNDDYTAYRRYEVAIYSLYKHCFRPILYVK